MYIQYVNDAILHPHLGLNNMSVTTKSILVFIGLTFFALGAAEMHVQERPCHDFYAVTTYPPIESQLHNNAVGAALALKGK